jgi:hypothetical protein
VPASGARAFINLLPLCSIYALLINTNLCPPNFFFGGGGCNVIGQSKQCRSSSISYSCRAMPVCGPGRHWLWGNNFSCAVIGLTFINCACRQRTGTPKFRGFGCQFPQSQCHPSPRTGIALGTRLCVIQLLPFSQNGLFWI